MMSVINGLEIMTCLGQAIVRCQTLTYTYIIQHVGQSHLLQIYLFMYPSPYLTVLRQGNYCGWQSVENLKEEDNMGIKITWEYLS